MQHNLDPVPSLEPGRQVRTWDGYVLTVQPNGSLTDGDILWDSLETLSEGADYTVLPNVRLVDTSKLSVGAGILLRELDLNVDAAAACSERMAARVTVPTMAEEYAAIARELRSLDQS